MLEIAGGRLDGQLEVTIKSDDQAAEFTSVSEALTATDTVADSPILSGFHDKTAPS